MFLRIGVVVQSLVPIEHSPLNPLDPQPLPVVLLAPIPRALLPTPIYLESGSQHLSNH